jgi:hypothetical protein
VGLGQGVGVANAPPWLAIVGEGTSKPVQVRDVGPGLTDGVAIWRVAVGDGPAVDVPGADTEAEGVDPSVELTVDVAEAVGGGVLEAVAAGVVDGRVVGVEAVGVPVVAANALLVGVGVAETAVGARVAVPVGAGCGGADAPGTEAAGVLVLVPAASPVLGWMSTDRAKTRASQRPVAAVRRGPQPVTKKAPRRLDHWQCFGVSCDGFPRTVRPRLGKCFSPAGAQAARLQTPAGGRRAGRTVTDLYRRGQGALNSDDASDEQLSTNRKSWCARDSPSRAEARRT